MALNIQIRPKHNERERLDLSPLAKENLHDEAVIDFTLAAWLANPLALNRSNWWQSLF
jgi:hypothetical protein